MTTKKEIKEAIEESQDAQQYNVGPRFELKAVEGLGTYVMFGTGWESGYPRTQVKFLTKLSKKHLKYVKNNAPMISKIIIFDSLGEFFR